MYVFLLATALLAAPADDVSGGAAVVGGGGLIGLGFAAKWLYDKWEAWRQANRTETVQDRDQRRKEAKEDEAGQVALMRETLERSERQRKEDKEEFAAQRREDRKEIHDMRDRQAATENRANAMEVRLARDSVRVQRMLGHIKYLESLLASRKIDVAPYVDDPVGDTDLHLALGRADTPTPPSPPREAK